MHQNPLVLGKNSFFSGEGTHRTARRTRTRTCKLVFEDRNLMHDGSNRIYGPHDHTYRTICRMQSPLQFCGPRTITRARTCKLVLKNPRGQGLSSRTTTLLTACLHARHGTSSLVKVTIVTYVCANLDTGNISLLQYSY